MSVNHLVKVQMVHTPCDLEYKPAVEIRISRKEYLRPSRRHLTLYNDKYVVTIDTKHAGSDTPRIGRNTDGRVALT